MKVASFDFQFASFSSRLSEFLPVLPAVIGEPLRAGVGSHGESPRGEQLNANDGFRHGAALEGDADLHPGGAAIGGVKP